MTLQQIIDERISFLKEQINPENKPEVNKTFQLHMDAIRCVGDNNIEKVESIISQKKALLKNCKDVYESDSCLQSWMAWNGCNGKKQDMLEDK